MKNQYRILVSGAGSIGSRHVRNLLSLGFGDISVYDPSEERLSRLVKECSRIQIHTDYDAALRGQYDAAFIASPNRFHIGQATDLAHRGCHLFIEKPLSHTMEGVDGLSDLLRRKNLISLVACNRRFQPAVRQTREAVSEGELGRILNYRIQCASYFPEWRPGADYRENYGASKEQGGGVILDMIHELDIARWIFGDVEEVTAVAGKRSDLDINVEDTAEIILRHSSGVLGQLGFSYATHGNIRSYHVAGAKGTLEWDFHTKAVRIFEAESKQWKTHAEFRDLDFNTPYLDMLKHFFACIETKTPSFQSVGEAKEALRLALAAKESAETEKKVALGQCV